MDIIRKYGRRGHNMKLHEKTTKSNAMLHVTLICTLVIAIVIFLFAKGYVADKLTFNIVRYMSRRKLLLLYLGVINLVTFILFGIDKYAAIKGKWRVKEFTLLLLSLLGGSISMFLTMLVIRHKTRKAKFMIGIPVIIILQIIIFIAVRTALYGA